MHTFSSLSMNTNLHTSVCTSTTSSQKLFKISGRAVFQCKTVEGKQGVLLDNFRKLLHLPAKLKRGQKGRIKIGSMPCPEPPPQSSLHAEWSSFGNCAPLQWVVGAGAVRLSGQSVPTFPSSPDNPPETDRKIWSTGESIPTNHPFQPNQQFLPTTQINH